MFVFKGKETFIDDRYKFLFEEYSLYYSNNYLRFCPNTKGNALLSGKLLHRVIYELEYGKFESVDIHHINENVLDNRLINLTRLTRSNHMKIHMKGENSPSYGKKQTTGHVEKRIRKLRGCKVSVPRHGENAPNFGKTHSKSAKAKMSEARKLYWEKRRTASV